MSKVKYIKTESNQIIVFPETMKHSQFKMFNPVSAGFVHITSNNRGMPTCTCYGESVSLKLKSDETDSVLAYRQILRYEY